MTLSDDRVGLLDSAVAADRNSGASRASAAAWPSPAHQAVDSPRGIADLGRYLDVAQAAAEADDLGTAYAQCSAAVGAAARWHAPPALAAALSLRSAVARQLGDLHPSAEDARRAGELLAEAGADSRSGPVLLQLARHLNTLVDLGEHAAADALLARSGLGELPDSREGVLLMFARARVHVAAGRAGNALPDLFHCGERLAAWQADRPALLPWRSEAAVALWRGGAHEAALRLAEAEVDLTRRAGTAAAYGRALRAYGVVLAGPPGLRALDESVRVFENSPRRFELAVSLVEAGTRLNELKRRPPARRLLRVALELAERCGSAELAERARRQYATSGGRPRPAAATGVSGLTRAERRAALMAAAERTNRQIAAELFLSVRTVEIHLTNAYRKLGITGRTELAAALAAPADQDTR
jgi:DNA-binding CsgD family transcriptional regulator